MHQAENAAPTDLHLVEQFCEKYPAWTPAAARSLILNADDRLNSRGEKIPGNGLAEAGAIFRIGRRVYISPSRFFQWIGAQQQKRQREAA